MTALSRKILIYGSINYFDQKTEDEISQIVTPEKFLRFYVNKGTVKDILKFQLKSVSGKLPKLKDKKLFVDTNSHKKKKTDSRAIRNSNYMWSTKFEINGWLNPIEIEIDDDRVLNALKNIKKTHKL